MRRLQICSSSYRESASGALTISVDIALAAVVQAVVCSDQTKRNDQERVCSDSC